VRVLNMVKDEGVQAVVHSGDFDYENSPAVWMDQLESILGDDFPYFASIGNHDNLQWSTYQRLLMAHNLRANVSCVGDIGVQATCTFQGLLMVISGVGTRPGDIDHDAYITQQLSQQDNIWKVVSWHKNHRDYQIGGKLTEVGLENYDAALEQGAILATGHEHSYCRSHLMSSFSEYTVVDTNNTINIEPGRSFVFVSGLGGQSIRDWNDNLIRNPWWAAYAASDNNVADGALFCTFNIENNPRLAECTFRDTNDVVWDTFRILSHNDGNRVKNSQPIKHRRQIHEVAVSSAEDDYSTNARGDVVQGDHLLLGTGFTTTLHFRTFHAARSLHRLQEVHLQLYGASAGEAPSFEIRAVVEGSRLTETAITWDYEEDNFTNESVWVSPDLTPLLAEIGRERDARLIQDLTLVITGKGFRKVWATDKDDCFAPTLSVVHKPRKQ